MSPTAILNVASHPLAVQVYDGNTADPTTVRDVIAKARRRFGLERVVPVGGRDKQPLRGKDKIGLRTGRVLNRFKVAKHFDIEITDQALRYQRRDWAPLLYGKDDPAGAQAARSSPV